MSQAGPCEYSLLNSNSEFLVLLELDSDKTLLGLISEKYEHQIFLDNRTINVLSGNARILGSYGPQTHPLALEKEH